MVAKLYPTEKEAIKTSVNSSEIGHCCGGAGSVDDFLAELWAQGFAVVPRTIVGIVGWTPAELNAYQMGIMYERNKNKSDSVPELE